MLGKIILPLEFCNRKTLKSKRIDKVVINASAMGNDEVVEKLQGQRNPLYSLLRQCQLVNGRYQEHFGEMIFHPIHPFLYSKRYQLIILRLFGGDITEYPMSTLAPVKGKKPRVIKEVDGKILHWSIADKLSDLDELLFGNQPLDILLPGDVANMFGMEIFETVKDSVISNVRTFGER